MSTVDKWEILSEGWQAELSKRGLKQLHMKELFRHIKGTEAEMLMEALALLVKAHTNKTFAYCISLRGWKS